MHNPHQYGTGLSSGYGYIRLEETARITGKNALIGYNFDIAGIRVFFYILAIFKGNGTVVRSQLQAARQHGGNLATINNCVGIKTTGIFGIDNDPLPRGFIYMVVRPMLPVQGTKELGRLDSLNRQQQGDKLCSSHGQVGPEGTIRVAGNISS